MPLSERPGSGAKASAGLLTAAQRDCIRATGQMTAWRLSKQQSAGEP